MNEKEQAIAAARRYAAKSGKYAMYMSYYGPLSGDTINMIVYTSTPQINFDRSLLVGARSAKKSYLNSKGRVNESQQWSASRIVHRHRVPGPYHIELVTVKLTRRG